MVSVKGINRARDFEELTERAPAEFDPETDDVSNNGDEDEDVSEDESEDGSDHARDHYAKVGKSQLRTPKTVSLGPQYRGSKVSRDAVLDDDDEDDPFGRGFDEEYSESGDSEEEEMGSEDAEDMTQGTSEENSFDEEDEDEDIEGEVPKQAPKVDRAELRKAFAEDQRAMASTISQSAKADAEKGRAVKRQRTGFDALLNGRVKLQKSLIGVNTLVGLKDEERDNGHADREAAITAAETAAFNLWSSLHDLREELNAIKPGEKRKRTQFSTITPTRDLWKQMQVQEASSLPKRDATLQKWSVKTRGVTATPQRSLMGEKEHQSTTVDVIREHLTSTERLMKRAHTPRSCAPLQLASRVVEDPKIYDDADFYGLLLKELLEQKSQDSVVAASVDLNFDLRRETKTRNNVDTKASKGRKLRYTVHEKLQNFMATEERASWGERQTDELFGSLFGKRLALGEDEERGEQSEVDEDVGEDGLMLFGP